MLLFVLFLLFALLLLFVLFKGKEFEDSDFYLNVR